jgi:predicted ATPase
MITLLETLNFRCLRYIHQPLEPFHVLVGPNASGKTTFLDVISFLNRLLSDGLEAAVSERTSNFQDLVWERSGNRFELALEARVPESISLRFSNQNQGYDTLRYEIAIGIDKETEKTEILEERVLLIKIKGLDASRRASFPMDERTLFPALFNAPGSLISKDVRNTSTIVNKVKQGNDYFKTEFLKIREKNWPYAFKLGPQKSALGNLPADETQFPATTWFRNLLTEGVQPFVLNSLLIRKASPPGQGRGFKPDGSNLPWVIEDLYRKNPARFNEWIAHLQTALPDIEGIRTVEREDDKHRYLIIKYKGGLEVPSWMVSDGTLRLLALTLPAYLTELKGIYLIEEPENGIHPRAVETVFQSLSSVYDAQILLATHSPVILSIAEANQVLCFAKTPEGSTDIVSGDMHPALKDWKGETNLGVLFASGVLG